MSQTIQTTDTLNAGRIKINDNFALPNFGVWNYNNSLASQSIPLNVWTKVNNNGAGASTYLGGALSGVTIYDTTNYQFDYTDLSLYDSVDIRFDANVTTTSANQEVRVRLLLSVGSLNASWMTGTWPPLNPCSTRRLNTTILSPGRRCFRASMSQMSNT